jgi:hypothetical protein
MPHGKHVARCGQNEQARKKVPPKVERTVSGDGDGKKKRLRPRGERSRRVRKETFRRREHQQGEREGEHLLLLSGDIGRWALDGNRFHCASAMRSVQGCGGGRICCVRALQGWFSWK